MLGNVISGLLSVAQGDDPEEILKKQMITTAMGGTAPAGVDSASNSMMTTLAEQGATDVVTPTLAGMQDQILSEVPQSVVNNSALQPQDFIGSHLTNDVNAQGLMNNYSGFTDAVPDPLSAYPNYADITKSTSEELAKADGGYGGMFDSIGDTFGQATDYLSDFTGLDRGDVSGLALNQGANLLQPTPPKPIQHATMEQGISRPNASSTKTAGSLMSSLPPATTTAYPGQEPIMDASQLTPEQIMKLKQQGIL